MALYMKESGPGDAPSVVWLHGGGLGGWMWEHQLKHFKDHHCIVPDMPGHGRSRGERFTMKGAAGQVARLIKDKAHGGKASVVGLSLGAQVLVEMLGSSPEVVDHAVINSALVRRLAYSKFLLNPTVLSLTAKMSVPLARSRAFARIQAGSYHLPEDMFEAYFDDTRRTTDIELSDVLRENAAYTMPEGLDNVKVPALVVIGEKEPLMYGSAKDLASALPGAKAYAARGVGHTFVFEKPELYARLVRAWVSDGSLPLDELADIK